MNNTIKCKICNDKFETMTKLSLHVRFKHKMTSYDYSLKYNYNGIIPECKCGCGKTTTFDGITKGFALFLKGHNQTYKSNSNTKIISCKNCGKTHEVKQHKTQQYCNNKCRHEHRKKQSNTIRICPTCKTEFHTKTFLPNKYCSLKCVHKSKDVHEKMKETCLKKYGVDNVFKSDWFKDHNQQQNLKRHGVLFNGQVKETKEKISKTVANHSTEFKQAIKNKVANTNLNKYGVKNVSQIADVKYKISKHKLSISYDKLISKFEHVSLLFNKSEYYGFGHNYDFKCNSCNTMFNLKLHGWSTPTCIKCNPSSISASKAESELIKYIISINQNIKISSNNNNILYPKEIDIWLPEYKTGIEFNGLYWHSTNRHDNPNYHINKTVAMNNMGNRLLHIFEDDWNFKKIAVKNIIRNIISPDNIEYSRIEIKTINESTLSEFMLLYGLSQYIIADNNIGLMYGKILIGIMSYNINKTDFNIIHIKTLYSPHTVLPILIEYINKRTVNRINITLDMSNSDVKLFTDNGFKIGNTYKPKEWFMHNYKQRIEHRDTLNDNINSIFDCGYIELHLTV